MKLHELFEQDQQNIVMPKNSTEFEKAWALLRQEAADLDDIKFYSNDVIKNDVHAIVRKNGYRTSLGKAESLYRRQLGKKSQTPAPQKPTPSEPTQRSAKTADVHTDLDHTETPKTYGDRFYGNQYTGSLGRTKSTYEPSELGRLLGIKPKSAIGRALNTVKSAAKPFDAVKRAFQLGTSLAARRR